MIIFIIFLQISKYARNLCIIFHIFFFNIQNILSLKIITNKTTTRIKANVANIQYFLFALYYDEPASTNS